MITDSFDDQSKALIDPEKLFPEAVKECARKYEIESIILLFSSQLMNVLMEKELIEPLDERLMFGSAAGKNPVCRIKNTKIGVFLSGIGAMMSAGMIEELHAVFGCKKFIVFGSCGALIDLPSGKLILPSEAYRDEGMSYHYAKPSDYIALPGSKQLAHLFDELKADYVTGKTWTTEAFYRETINNREKRIKEGCICVEMECSALQAVCDFRGLELFVFLYAADSLNSEWSRRILGNLEMDHRIAYFYLAEEIAKRI